ncbi:hypothetical protein I4U23_005194 [Adineta vaga]|nr:hypothetical protein I4U23_005194 [Adineta vaga]
MSAEYDFIEYLIRIQTNSHRFGGPILIIFGTISCILSLLIFTKNNLRKNPCSIYFMAYNTVCLIMIYTIILPYTLSIGYNIDTVLLNINICRFRLYNILLSDVLGPSYLILASIDRILITSRNARTRHRSTVRSAYLSIFLIALFWLLITSHTLIFARIIPIGPSLNIYYFQSGDYYIFISYYAVIFKGFLCPLSMIIFGLWSIKNVRSLVRIHPNSLGETHGTIQNNACSVKHSKDRQLFRILIYDIFIYLTFNLMLSIVLIYQQIVQPSSENIIDNQLRTFYIILGTFSCYIPSCIGFYSNLFISKMFRNSAKQVFLCKDIFCLQQRH